jgi:uncharacterized protein with GYD domain
MATFLILGKYSSEGLEGMSAERTEKSAEVIKKFGGKVKAEYALLGEYDLAAIVEAPGIEQVMQASVAESKLTKISWTTFPAVPIEDFDKLMAEVWEGLVWSGTAWIRSQRPVDPLVLKSESSGSDGHTQAVCGAPSFLRAGSVAPECYVLCIEETHEV